MSPVPVVDLRSSDAADALEAALRATGFAELVAHGASKVAAEDLRAACDHFFALPDEVKRSHVHPEPVANRGFRAKGAEALSYSLGAPSPPDLFESFNCGPDSRIDGSPLFQPTPWPDDGCPELRPAAHAWMDEMAALSCRIDTVLGEILDVDLAGRSQHGPDTLACIDYRPGNDGTEPAVAGQNRMGAHSDYTSFTLLHADPVPGLQIVADGRWIDVVPQPGSILLNVGDVLAMATNDRWPSTLHRVVPIADGCAARRRSLAWFHYPDPDETVEVLPYGRVAGAPRYEPVTVADHLLGKLTAPKEAVSATAASTAAGRLS